MSKRRVMLVLGACLGLLLPAGQASSAVRPHSFYLSPQAGGYFFHEDQGIKDSPIYGLGVGYRFSSHWSAELIGSYIDTELKDIDLQFDTYLGRLEVAYNFFPEGRFVPYLALGFGGIIYDSDEFDLTDTDALAGYGLGFQYFLSESVALRVDGRHFFTAENEDLDGKEFQHFSATGGMLFQFGGDEGRPRVLDGDGDGVIDAFDRCPGTRLGVPVDGYGCPADADRDGTPDYLDQCPDTPATISAGRDGCPADRDRDGVADFLDRCPDLPAGKDGDPNGCPADRDSDSDGVGDRQDRCPDTPAGTPVNAAGCPTNGDSDGDGVIDADDKCPGTPAGVVVDSSGCVGSRGQLSAPGEMAIPPVPSPPVGPAPDVLELNLEFLPRQADLRPAFEAKLEEAVRFIAAHPGQRIVVEGHTDAVGPADFNLKLSRERAENVRRYLIEKASIRPEMIAARGFGETRPVADNATQYGRIQNRRVVIRLADGQ